MVVTQVEHEDHMQNLDASVPPSLERLDASHQFVAALKAYWEQKLDTWTVHEVVLQTLGFDPDVPAFAWGMVASASHTGHTAFQLEDESWLEVDSGDTEDNECFHHQACLSTLHMPGGQLDEEHKDLGPVREEACKKVLRRLVVAVSLVAGPDLSLMN
jgi:hypothetical protein